MYKKIYALANEDHLQARLALEMLLTQEHLVVAVEIVLETRTTCKQGLLWRCS